MSDCAGCYQPAIRRHPLTGAGECPSCGRRFDLGQLAGYRMNLQRPWEPQNVPMHSPCGTASGQLAVIEAEQIAKAALAKAGS